MTGWQEVLSRPEHFGAALLWWGYVSFSVAWLSR